MDIKSCAKQHSDTQKRQAWWINNSTNLLPKDNLILTGNGAEEPKYYYNMFKKTLIRMICIIKSISCLPAGLAVPKIMEQILESV